MNPILVDAAVTNPPTTPAGGAPRSGGIAMPIAALITAIAVLATVMIAAVVIATVASAVDASEIDEWPFEDVDDFDGQVIDLATWYTDGFSDSLGGPAAASARLAIVVNNTNLAFANSGVNTRVRLVHVDVTDAATILTTGTPHTQMLNAVNADLGIFLASPDEGQSFYQCGLSGQIGVARAGVEDCVLTFAHEIGHRLGANHCVNDRTWPNGPPAGVNWAAEIPGTPWMTLMCKGGQSSFTADRTRRVVEFSDANTAEMNSRVNAVANMNPPAAGVSSHNCLSYLDSTRIVSCSGNPLVQEAEGSQARLQDLFVSDAVNVDRFVTYRDTENAASGRYFIASARVGDTYDFEVDVPTAGAWTLTARAMSRQGPSSVQITTAGGTVQWALPTEATWQYRDVTTVVLPAGPTTITLEALDVGAAFDLIQLRPAEIPAIDLARLQRADDLVTAFEAHAATTGSYVIGGGHQDRGEGAVYGSNTADYATGSIAQALSDAGISVDVIHPAGVPKWEILAIRCADRIGIFTGSETIVTATADTQWWADNNCIDFALNNGRPHLALSGPAPVVGPSSLDIARSDRVSDLVAAFEGYGTDTGTYVVGGGFEDRGYGAVYGVNATTYAAGSIAQALNDAGVAVDPAHPPTVAKWEILALRCKDRVAIFSGSETITPLAADTQWWTDNGCSTWALNNGRPYFELSAPVTPVGPSALDLLRVERIDELIAGFEAYASDAGTYEISGGHHDRGVGAVYWTDSSAYTFGSIAQALNDAGVAVETNHPAPVERWEILTMRCADRIAVFSSADNLTTDAADAHWWADNDCSAFPLNNGRPYFKISAPLSG